MNSDPRIPRPPAADASQKEELRSRLLAARRAIDDAARAQWDAALCARVVDWWRTHRVPALGVYWPLRGEPDLQPAYGELARLGVQLLLPVVVERHAPLAFAHWDIGEPMVRDRMGVAVPATLRLTGYPPALLVPCLGFNAGRYRLGYGGGFYDRTLAHAPRPVAVGIAYACMEAPFAHDAHDVALDAVLTEA